MKPPGARSLIGTLLKRALCLFDIAFVKLPYAWLLLRFRGPKALLGTQQALADPLKRGAPDIAATHAMVEAAARLSPSPSTCLTRAVVLEKILRRQGVPCELRIGVRTQRGQLQAHAWVESEFLVASEADKFSAFDAATLSKSRRPP